MSIAARSIPLAHGPDRGLRLLPGGRSTPRPDFETALINASAGADERAFAELYRIMAPEIARFVERLTRDPEAGQSIANDTMHEVWRRARQFDGTSTGRTWILALAYRLAQAHIEGSTG